MQKKKKMILSRKERIDGIDINKSIYIFYKSMGSVSCLTLIFLSNSLLDVNPFSPLPSVTLLHPRIAIFLVIHVLIELAYRVMHFLFQE